MDSNVWIVIITGTTTLIGVWIGSALNQRQVRKREIRERLNIRTLLRKECDYNIAALKAYWPHVFGEGVYVPGRGQLLGISPSNDGGNFDKLQRLALEPMPVWQTLMWSSQAGMVASALDHPGELDHVYQLYADLKTFTVRRDELRAMLETGDGRKLADEYNFRMVEIWEHNTNPTPDLYKEAVGLDAKLREFYIKTLPLRNECIAVYGRVVPYTDSPIIEDEAPPARRRDRIATWFKERRGTQTKPANLAK